MATHVTTAVTTVVTTVSHPPREVVARAQQVGARCGLPVVRRRMSLPRLLSDHDATLAYVAGRVRDELRSTDAGVFVHSGMLQLKRNNGLDHPFLRSLRVHGRCESIFDATVGLAADALHAADMLEIDVRGTEASPIMFSLLEDGLARLAAGDEAPQAAARISVELADAHAVLQGMASGSVDVVTVDPMFDSPRAAAPGFPLVRQVAETRHQAQSLVEVARRVAASHVVLKYPKRATYPPCDHCVNGKAVRYLIYDARP